MAAGLQARYAAAQDVNFQQRITESISEAALAIYFEGSGVAGHARRAAFAVSILGSPGSFTYAFALACVGQAVDNTSNDAAINNAVASVYNALAGA